MEYEPLDPDDGHLEEWLRYEPPPAPPSPRPRGTAQSMLMAAMLGLADALGWEKPSEETVQVADAPLDDGLDLSFGPLDPLDN